MKTTTAILRMVNMRIERSTRRKTQTSYSQWGNAFISWMLATEQPDTLHTFTKGMAYKFLDYLTLEKKLSNRTVNNHKGFVSGCFQELVHREYITKNPFAGIPDRRVIREKRDAFTQDEVLYLLKTIKRQDPMLYLFVLFVYGALIRPIEVARLRYHMVDLGAGLVNMPADITKNWTHGHPTLPTWIVKEMRRIGVQYVNPAWYIFGRGFVSGLDGPCGQHSANRRHKYYIDKGKRCGLLRQHAKLSLYSWKYTAGDELATKLNPYELQKQMRHKRLETTMLYLKEQVGIIQGVRDHQPGNKQLPG